MPDAKKSPKISLTIGKEISWHVLQLKKEAKKRQIQFETIAVRDLNNSANIRKRLGDVIIWRSHSFSSAVERATFLSTIKNKIIINPSILTFPFVPRKIFQQSFIAARTPVSCIPTFVFRDKGGLKKSIRTGKLTYPFIKKPDLGAQGNDIEVLRSEKDVLTMPEGSLKDYVFQNFIENDGDYRALVLGGKVLGVVKRTPKKGGFLNNISQGGTARVVTDPAALVEVQQIALMVASALNLTFCGVDVIYNSREKKYQFLEVNTVPQWRGFQKATGINVSGELLDLCCALHSRASKPTSQLVSDCFEKNYLSFAPRRQFHYASRMHLWGRSRMHGNRLERLKDYYLGKNQNQLADKIRGHLAKSCLDPDAVRFDLRKKYFKKYPKLRAYNKALALALFAETIFGKDIRAVINEFIPKKNLLNLKDALLRDKQAVAALSTYAVNFFYYLKNYLRDESLFDPKIFLDAACQQYRGALEKCSDLRIYLLTHAIIGETRFYKHPIKDMTIYTEMLRFLEKEFYDNYFALPLDVKFEFLVCARICCFATPLDKLILAEADRSLADSNNFLVSTLNDRRAFFMKNVEHYEHTNVLYLMASQPFAPNAPKPIKRTTKQPGAPRH